MEAVNSGRVWPTCRALAARTDVSVVAAQYMLLRLRAASGGQAAFATLDEMVDAVMSYRPAKRVREEYRVRQPSRAAS